MSASFAEPVPCGRCNTPLPPEVEQGATCLCGAREQVYRFRPTRSAALAAAALPSPQVSMAMAVCAYHAGNPASQACRRCGSFICSLCALTVGREIYCPSCFEKLLADGSLDLLHRRYPRLHARAAWLSMVTFFMPPLGLLLAPVVVWLALRALKSKEDVAERDRGVVATVLVALLFAVGSILLGGLMLWGLVSMVTRR